MADLAFLPSQSGALAHIREHSHQDVLARGDAYSGYWSQWDPIIEVSFVRTDDYYDLHVPGEEHYLANGIWSHNTGKTTVAKAIAERFGQRVAFCAPTGKAALVLRRKGVAATTVHSLIYRPIAVSEKELERLTTMEARELDAQRKSALQEKIRELIKAISSPSFYLRDELEEMPDAIILDESSMVSGQMLQDLMSFGAPVLALGDPAQLPPVNATTPLSQDGFVPTIALSTPHRFADRSPVHHFATQVRLRGPRGVDEWRAGSGLNEVETFDMTPDAAAKLLGFDQVICGRNETRQRLNYVMRTALGREPDDLDDEDRLVCLRNQPRLGLVNGEQYTVAELTEMRVPDAKIERIEGLVPPGVFPLFAWAYAITAHKSQGSEWPRIVVFDESAMFGKDAGRWLYTAITRAADAVVVLRMRS